MDDLDNYVSLFVAAAAVIYSIITVLRSIFGPDRISHETHDEADEDEENYEEMLRQEEEEIHRRQPVVRIPAQKYEKTFVPKPPAVAIDKKYDFHAGLDDFSSHSPITDQQLTIHLRSENELVSDAFRLAQNEGSVLIRPKKPTIQQLIKSLPQEKLLFLSYEVFHVPVSKRSSPFPWNG